MTTVKMVGGWMVAGFCLPLLAVLATQRPTPITPSTPLPNPASPEQLKPEIVVRSSESTPQTPPVRVQDKPPARDQDTAVRQELRPFDYRAWFRTVAAARTHNAHLVGVSGLTVVSCVVGDDVGLTENSTSNLVANRLRQAGIKPFLATKEGEPKTPHDGKTLLGGLFVAEVTALGHGQGSLTRTINIECYVLRDCVSEAGQTPARSVAKVWSAKKTGYAGVLRANETATLMLNDQLESLVNAIATANGR